MKFDEILRHVEEAGFVFLGGIHCKGDEPVATPEAKGVEQTLVLIGNAGPAMWQNFNQTGCPNTRSLDSWTRDTITALAEFLGAGALFPFDEPPPPFLRWAQISGSSFTSPLGLSIHPVYGLWHGYRAALLFDNLVELPAVATVTSPCETCSDKPCLSACPVQAMTPKGYDVPACIDHIKTTDQPDCYELGCRARRACPIGQDYLYTPGQAKFHMSAFVKANG